jgi:outer membrane biosynthesis protein TonB
MDLVSLKKEEQKSKLIGYGTTAAIHAALFVLLWFAVLHTPDPPLKYGGMELSMSLGEPDMGGPSDIPVETPTPVEPIPETQTEDQIITQDVEDVGSVAKKTEVVKKIEVTKPTVKPTKPIEKPIEKPRVADERSLFKKKTTTNPSEGGRGDGSVAGNEGRADGDPNGSPDGNGIGNGLGGSGGGTGNTDGWGGSYVLAGRKLSERPNVTDNSKETGKVVVGITVDRTGKVIKVQPGIKGTTNLSPVLLEKARQGAMQARFSAKPDGPEEQYGTMTFVFKFKQ